MQMLLPRISKTNQKKKNKQTKNPKGMHKQTKSQENSYRHIVSRRTVHKMAASRYLSKIIYYLGHLDQKLQESLLKLKF